MVCVTWKCELQGATWCTSWNKTRVLCAPDHRAISLGPSEPHFKQFNLIWKLWFFSKVLSALTYAPAHWFDLLLPFINPRGRCLDYRLQSHDFHAIKPTRAAHPGETPNTASTKASALQSLSSSDRENCYRAYHSCMPSISYTFYLLDLHAIENKINQQQLNYKWLIINI